jgi:hypothetical protein
MGGKGSKKKLEVKTEKSVMGDSKSTLDLLGPRSLEPCFLGYFYELTAQRYELNVL